MAPKRYTPDIHRPNTAAGETSVIEIEVFGPPYEGYVSYRIDQGPSRTIAPGHRLHRTLAELLRVIDVGPHPVVTEYERHLHEDVLAYERERREREEARLYGVREPRPPYQRLPRHSLAHH